jgi:hypothetical protein
VEGRGGITVTDLDGDGRQDLFVGGPFVNSIAVLRYAAGAVPVPMNVRVVAAPGPRSTNRQPLRLTVTLTNPRTRAPVRDAAGTPRVVETGAPGWLFVLVRSPVGISISTRTFLNLGNGKYEIALDPSVPWPPGQYDLAVSLSGVSIPPQFGEGRVSFRVR